MKKLDDELLGVTELGFDTTPFIYFIERNQTYLAVMREIMNRLDGGAVLGFGSTLVLTEVLVHPKRLNNPILEEEYRNILLQSRGFSLVDIDVAVADQAAGLRAKYGLRTPDAIQAATAIVTGCQAFLTNDLNYRKVTEIRVLILDELEL